MHWHRVKLVAGALVVVVVLLGSGWPAGLATWAEILSACTLDTTPGRCQNDSPAEATAVYTDVGHVTALAFDGMAAWAGTADGQLVRLDTTTGEQTRFAYPVAGVAIRSLVRDARGVVWAATEGGGLGCFDPGPNGRTWQTFDPSNSDFPSDHVRAVALDPAERVWAATDVGVAYLDGDQWVTYNTRNSALPGDNVTAILPGEATWVGTDAGLARLADGQWKIIQSGNSDLPDDHITALAEDHRGSLWVGTESGAFQTPGRAWRTHDAQARFDADGSSWTQFPQANGWVRGLVIDAADRVWLNWGDRVGRLSTCDWTTYDGATLGLAKPSIAVIAIDPLGRLWVGGEGGLARLADRGEQARWSPTKVTQPVQALVVGSERVWAALADGTVSSVDLASQKQTTITGPGGEPRSAAVDPQGRLWIGTWGQGIAVRDRNDWHRYSRANVSLPSDFVSGVAVAPDGTVWAATASGIAALDAQTQEWRSLKGGRILAVAAAADGRVAFGSYGDGVSLYDPVPRPGLDGKTWTNFTSANSALPSDYVQAVAFDAQGRLWAGTQGGGVACFNAQGTNLPNALGTDPGIGQSWTAYPAGANGPMNEFVSALGIAQIRALGLVQIRALGVSAMDHVWAGAPDGGLAEFDGCMWTHYPAAAAALPGGVAALAAAPDGTLWVGGKTGLFTVRPMTAPVSASPVAQAIRRSAPTRATAPQTAVSQSLPDTDRWTSHTVGRSAHAFAFSGDDVWEATLGGGLLRWCPSDGSFTRFQYPQDGLPSNRIVFVAVDPGGRVWAATQDRGVAVYDGRRWTTYDTHNSGLSHDDVNGVAFDSKGRAWLATLGGGVCMFDPGQVSGQGGQKWTVYRKNAGLAGDQVWYVAVDAQDRVWAGTIDGLSVFDPDSGKRWVTFPNTQNVHCIAFDAQGQTWFGDGYGLNRVDGEKVVPIRTGEYQPWTKDVYSIRFDPQGAAWLGTGTGIWRYIEQSFSRIAMSTTGLPGTQVYAVGLDSQGNVWFGTDGADGAARFGPVQRSGLRGAAWQTFRTSTGPNPVDGSVQRLFVDRQGRLWVGCYRGLSVYDGRGWTGYTTENSGLLSDSIQSIAQGPDGRLWLGTPSGISVFDAVQRSRLDPMLRSGLDGADGWETITASQEGTPGLLDNAVNVVRFDGRGRAWIGSARGLSVFDPLRGQGWRNYTEANTGIDLRDVQDLAIDRQGRVWVVSTNPDAYVLGVDNRWTKITREEYGLQSFSLMGVAVDPRDRVWLAAFDGLTMFDPGLDGGTWTAVKPFPKDSRSFSVFDIAFDAQGQAWLGGYGGLARQSGTKWIAYTFENSPLPDESVSAVAIDGKGHVWVGSSSYGLAELAPAAKRFPVRATATSTPPIPTAVAPPTSVPLASAGAPTRRPAPTATPTRAATPTVQVQIPAQTPAPRFEKIWQDEYGGEHGSLGQAVAPARQTGCADERFEHGLMFWRNNQPQQSAVCVMWYGTDTNGGVWQAFADSWTSDQPDKGGFKTPADRFEPVRGFGKVWREQLGGGPSPSSIGWAVEPEQGAPQAEYQDFQGGAMWYSPRLGQIFVLKSDGTWKSHGAE